MNSICKNGIASVFLLCVVTLPVAAAQAPATSYLFIPKAQEYYMPFGKLDERTPKIISTRALTNSQLEQDAAYIRSHSMSLEQRQLNHQWLDEDYDNDVRIGTKVLSHVMKIGFRHYWEDVRQQRLSDYNLPDEDGNGRIKEDVKYKLRLSGNKLKLMLEYDF